MIKIQVRNNTKMLCTVLFRLKTKNMHSYTYTRKYVHTYEHNTVHTHMHTKVRDIVSTHP